MLSLTVPVQIAMPNIDNSWSASTSGGDSTISNEKSFADCLKETHDDSDKENQTATTPRPRTSPKHAADRDKQQTHRGSKDGSAPYGLVDTTPQPQVLDTRSLKLSLQKAPTAKVHPLPVTASQQSPVSTAAVPKTPIAFGVSISKQGGNNPTIAAVNTANPDSAGAQSNFKDSKDGGTSQDSSDGNAAATLLKAASDTAAATTTPVHTDNTAVPAAQAAVPMAYSNPQPQIIKPAAPTSGSAPVAAVSDPPAAPSVRPHSIEIQVPGHAGEQVDVRVSQRAGDVEVTVRTPDNDLAQSLRQHLPELSDRLNQADTTAQIWQPAATSEASNGNTSNHEEQNGSAWHGQQQQNSQQQQPQADTDSQQNNSRGGNQWIDSFYNAEQESR
jgi:hypothetical protein